MKSNKNSLPEYSQYCEVCKSYKDCGPQKVSCIKFDVIDKNLIKKINKK